MLRAMGDERSVIVIGNFDGVHLGHQALFAEARQLADERGGRVVAVTFDRHPITVLRPDEAPPMLMHVEGREAKLRSCGVDDVRWLSPTPELLGLEPRQFIERMVDEHQPIGFVEGRNFRFGHKRHGGPDQLVEYGKAFGYETRLVDVQTVTLRDKTQAPLSSTLVRWLVGHGRMADAAVCLGRPWQMVGDVVEGERRGRTIGVPTANLDTADQMLPADGVYAGLVERDGATHAAAISVGVKPTFGRQQRLAEVHLLGFDGDLYGRSLTVKMCRWLRDQHAFNGVEALKQQLNHDMATVRRLHATGLLDPAQLVIA